MAYRWVKYGSWNRKMKYFKPVAYAIERCAQLDLDRRYENQGN